MVTGATEQIRNRHDMVTGSTEQIRNRHDMVTGSTEQIRNRHDMVTGATEQIRNRHDMVTGATEQICNRHDMVTGATEQIGNCHDMARFHEEVTYCPPSTPSWKQKNNRSTSQPQFRSENTPRRSKQTKFCWPFSRWQKTTILRSFTITSTEFPNCQSH